MKNTRISARIVSWIQNLMGVGVSQDMDLDQKLRQIIREDRRRIAEANKYWKPLYIDLKVQEAKKPGKPTIKSLKPTNPARKAMGNH